MVIFLKKMSFQTALWNFWAKKKKQKTLNVGKIRNYGEEEVFSREKRFHLLKLHLYQIGKAQKMPVKAGCFIVILFRPHSYGFLGRNDKPFLCNHAAYYRQRQWFGSATQAGLKSLIIRLNHHQNWKRHYEQDILRFARYLHHAKNSTK